MASDLSVSRIACDFIVLTFIAIPLLIFHKWVNPYVRGFYCDDESIRYPFRVSTVSRQKLIVVGILIPSLLILATEALRTIGWERRHKHSYGNYRFRQYKVHRLVVRLYVFLGYFFVGVCFNQLMVDIAKYTIGRHRPHFMEVCKPEPGYSTCANDHKYITNFTCTGTNQFLIHESMLSFYSGHSAFSFYAAWYTTFYLQARLYKPLYSRLLLPVIQFALFAGATFVAYTRISDYKHHWSDVLVGSIMGSVIGIINALFVAEVFERREIPCDYRCKTFILGGTQPSDMHNSDLEEDQSSGTRRANKFDPNSTQSSEKQPRSHLPPPPSPPPPLPTKIIVNEEHLPAIMHPSKVELANSHQFGYTAHYKS